eukprot:COSAG05_NODE_5506_length_1157_cov_1.743856_1_plen_187_part_10
MDGKVQSAYTVDVVVVETCHLPDHMPHHANCCHGLPNYSSCLILSTMENWIAWLTNSLGMRADSPALSPQMPCSRTTSLMHATSEVCTPAAQHKPQTDGRGGVSETTGKRAGWTFPFPRRLRTGWRNPSARMNGDGGGRGEWLRTSLDLGLRHIDWIVQADGERATHATREERNPDRRAVLLVSART